MGPTDPSERGVYSRPRLGGGLTVFWENHLQCMLREKIRASAKLGWGLLLLTLVCAGCAILRGQSEEEPENERAGTVHVYDESELPRPAYEIVGSVTGTACKENVYASPPDRAEAIAELKQRARQEGGEALINVQCRRRDGSDACPGALRCTGEAVRVASVETVAGASRRTRSDRVGDDVQAGTGWVLAPGIVVTSYRLVQDRSAFSVSLPDTTVSAEVVATDEVHSLAFLRPDRPSLLPASLPLARDSVRVGESVFTVGYPSFGNGKADVRTATGIISAQSGALGDARVYRTSAVGVNETGGAPLLDYRGRVIGVLIPQSGSVAGTIDYAVQNTYLRRLRTRFHQRSDSLTAAPDREAFDRDQSSLHPLLERVTPSVLPVVAR